MSYQDICFNLMFKDKTNSNSYFLKGLTQPLTELFIVQEYEQWSHKCYKSCKLFCIFKWWGEILFLLQCSHFHRERVLKQNTSKNKFLSFFYLCHRRGPVLPHAAHAGETDTPSPESVLSQRHGRNRAAWLEGWRGLRRGALDWNLLRDRGGADQDLWGEWVEEK